MTSLLHLTEQQHRVVALVAEGLLNKQIGHQLGIAEATVKVHIHAALDRLGFTNRVQLAVWYVRQDIESEVIEKKPWHECSPAERDERLRADGLRWKATADGKR